MSPEEGRSVDLGGLRLWARDAGRGPAVLCISGLGYSDWYWQEFRELLGGGYRIITFDNRGTGRSDKPAGPYSMALLADDAARLLGALAAGPAHVVAHSMGGYIALTLALHHPRLVRSLVLSGTGPGGGGAVSIPPETQAAWNAAIGLAPQDSARRTMPYSFPPHWTERHPERFEHILARRLRHPTPPACWAAQYAACVEHFHNGLDAERIHASALILHGDGDRVVPVANGCLLAGRMPHAQLRIVPGGGHLLALEDPPAFAAEVRDFIAQVEARAPA